MEFMQVVVWKRRPVGGPLSKLSCMWSDGFFLGVNGGVGEFIVEDERGVWRTRTMRRKPEPERWTKSNLKMIGGVPWKTSDQDPSIDGEDMKMMVTVMDKEYRERVMAEAQILEKAPRRFNITKQDLEKHGYTKGCPSCSAVLRKVARQSHT